MHQQAKDTRNDVKFYVRPSKVCENSPETRLEVGLRGPFFEHTTEYVSSSILTQPVSSSPLGRALRCRPQGSLWLSFRQPRRGVHVYGGDVRQDRDNQGFNLSCEVVSAAPGFDFLLILPIGFTLALFLTLLDNVPIINPGDRDLHSLISH